MDLPCSSLGLVSAGLDYITLTSTNSHTISRMRSFFAGVSVRDKRLGYDTKSGGAFGFYGQRARHALLGALAERTMLQVTGQEAQGAIRLTRPGDNATRLDIQVTMRVEPGTVNTYLQALGLQARGAPAIRGKRPKVKMEDGDHGIETVYIGRRKSDVFIRCYDKFEESGKEEWKDCVRLEVEIKGKTAKALWNHCAETGEGTGFLCGILRTLLERRGIDCSWVEWPNVAKTLPLKEITSLERRRSWWSRQVAPGLAREVLEFGWYTAFSILFDGCLTQWDRTAIMNALSVQWGN